MDKIRIFLFLILSIVIISCSDGENENVEPIPEERETPPETIQIVELPEFPKLENAVNLGNEGAMMAQYGLGLVEGIQSYYELLFPPDGFTNDKIIAKLNDKIWDYVYTIDELKITFSFMDIAEFWSIEQIYNGRDPSGNVYNDWTKGYFIFWKNEFEGDLEIYEFGQTNPVVDYEWWEDSVEGKIITFNMLNIIRLKLSLNYKNSGNTVLEMNSLGEEWEIVIKPDGSGEYFVFDMNGNPIRNGSW